MNFNQESSLPPNKPLDEIHLTSAVSSTSISISPLTTCLELSAISGGLYFLVGSGTVTTLSGGFSGYVQAGSTRHYNINKGTTSIQVIATGEVIAITYE